MENNHISFLRLLFSDDEESRKKIFRSMKAKANARRTFIEKMADWMTSHFGSIGFLLLNVFVFIAWILINTDTIKGITAFDPFPFNLLTTAVSLEAIYLSIFIQMTVNRNTQSLEEVEEDIEGIQDRDGSVP